MEMQMKKTTKSAKSATTTPLPKVSVKVAVTKSEKTKAAKDIPSDAIEKMTKWNKTHPTMAFSWAVISATLPAAKRICKTCKKEFREGRVTRVDETGAYCGPRCQLKAANAGKSSK
jgi:hypothetical protein